MQQKGLLVLIILSCATGTYSSPYFFTDKACQCYYVLKFL